MPAPLHEDDPILLQWTRAQLRYSRQEEKTARAIQIAEQAAYFTTSPAACSDTKARAILARAAMGEEQRRLRIRRRELEQAEKKIAPILRNHYNREEQ